MSGIDVDTMISELKEHLGVDTELDSTDALLLLNRSWWEFQNKTPLRQKEKTVEFDIGNTSDFYEVPQPIEATRSITLIDPDTLDQFKLERMSRDRYDELVNDSPELQEQPTHYVRENNGFKLWPFPDKTYRLKFFRYLTLNDLAVGEDIDVPLFWHEVILFGAVYRGYMRINEPLRADFFRKQQADVMNTAIPTEAEEEADSQLAGMRIVGYVKSDIYN